MNLSGLPLPSLLGQFGCDPSHLVVLHDDMDLELVRGERREEKNAKKLGNRIEKNDGGERRERERKKEKKRRRGK